MESGVVHSSQTIPPGFPSSSSFLILLFFFLLSPLQVHVPNSCEFGTRGDVEEVDELVATDPEELKKDPLTCFFENQHHAHGSNWTPNYNKCFSCSCQVQTTRGND